MVRGTPAQMGLPARCGQNNEEAGECGWQRHDPALLQAVRSRHVPKSMREAEEARQRLAFEELLVLQLRLLLQRTSTQCAPLPLHYLFLANWIPDSTDLPREIWCITALLARAMPHCVAARQGIDSTASLAKLLLPLHVERVWHEQGHEHEH